MKALKVIKTIFNVISWLLIICMVAVMAVSMFTQMTGGVPSMFGYSVLRVITPSMTPYLEVGDVICDQVVDEQTQLKEGDVITFNGVSELKGKLVTHRIVKAPYLDGSTVKLQTQGDANTFPDTPIPLKNVVGLYQFKIPVLTAIYNFIYSKWGIVLIVALLLFIFFGEIRDLFKSFRRKKAPAAEDNAEINKIIEGVKSRAEDSDDSNVID